MSRVSVQNRFLTLYRRRQTPRLRFERLESRNLLASWVEGFGGAGAEYIRGSQAMDPSGNLFISGYFSQTVDFDAGPGSTNHTSNGGADAFAAKYASDGALVWARSFGGTFTGDDARTSVYSSEQDGNYLYVAGIFSNTVNFGGTAGVLTSSGSTDAFILKLDAATGSTLWSKRLGGTGSDVPTNIAVTHDSVSNTERIHVAGRFDSTADFDPGPGVVSLSPIGKGKNREFDGFLSTLDRNGNYVSVWQLGGSGADDISSLETDGTSLFLAGKVTGTVDLNPGPGIMNASDSFVAKYTNATSGVPAWVKSTDGGFYLAADMDNLYVTGANGIGPTISKFSKANGSTLWTEQVNSAGTYGATTSVVDTVTGSLYVSGYISSNVDFNADAIGGEVVNQGGTDGFLLKLNAGSGDYQNVWQLGGSAHDRAFVMGFKDTTLFVSGTFGGTANFPTGETIIGSTSDFFLMAFDQASTVRSAPMATSRWVQPNWIKLSVEIVEFSRNRNSNYDTREIEVSRKSLDSTLIKGEVEVSTPLQAEASSRSAPYRDHLDQVLSDVALVDSFQLIDVDLIESTSFEES